MPDEIKVMQNELVCTNCKIKGCFRDCTICPPVFEDSEIIAAYEAAIEALKKRIPKKVIPIKPNGYYQCPVCGEEHYIGGSARYCNLCGQRLEWPEVEE